MSSVPMPRDLSEEAVAEWLYYLQIESPAQWRVMARAVRAMVREKVREAVVRTNADARDGKWIIADEVVARVMGDHPSNAENGGSK